MAKESKTYFKICFEISTLIGNCKQYEIDSEEERRGQVVQHLSEKTLHRGTTVNMFLKTAEWSK